MQFIKKLFRRKIFIFGLIIVVIAVVYYGYQSAKGSENVPRYVTAAVNKGTLIVTVSGTGQVAVSHQVDVKPKGSGEVTSINVQDGQQIKAGTVIAQLDATDAQKAVRDAQIGLQDAQISLQKLQKPTDSFTIAQAQSDLEQSKLNLTKLQQPPTQYDLIAAQDSVTQAQRDLDQANDNVTKANLDTTQTLQKAYDDGYSSVSNAYLDMPNAISDLHDAIAINQNGKITDLVYYYKVILGQDSAIVASLVNENDAISSTFKDSFDNYKTIPRTADQATKYKLLGQTLDTAKSVSEALESARNVLDASVSADYEKTSVAPIIDELRPKIQTDIATVNKDIADLQNAKDTIDTTNQNSPLDLKSSQAAIAAAQEKLKEKQAYLANLQAGPTPEDIQTAQQEIQQKQNALDKLKVGADPLDVKSQLLAIQQRQNDLQDAQKNLADYSVKAPFDGVVAKVNVSKGDVASSSVSVVTMITNELVAEISLNEVDAAKIEVGDKTTLTFDALPDLSITGKVEEIDLLGTVTQGVVTYTVKIGFDTQDPRVKSNMSVSASIITDVKQDVLLVPSSAVKTQGTTNYVEMIDNPTTTPARGNNQTQMQTQETTDESTSGNTIVTSKNPPRQQPVEVGLSNDTDEEITSGLKEGDKIIIQTLTTSKTSGQAQSGAGGLRLFGGAGGGGGGGGFTGANRGGGAGATRVGG